MFRRSTVALVVLLSSATAGAALAQQPAGAKPPAAAPKSTVMQDTTHKAAMKKPAWTKDQIKAAQLGLTKAKVYKGDTSGVMNGATRKAIREYQKQNKLPVTGTLSNDLLTKLGGH